MIVENLRKTTVEAAIDHASGIMTRITCVIVTHDRPTLLCRCIESVQNQSCAPNRIVVVDNASGPATQLALASFPDIDVLRMATNVGGAGGFKAGIEYALLDQPDFVWLMDDDGHPSDPTCLATLTETARREDADITAPVVIDDADEQRLAFALRVAGRTLFGAHEIPAGSVLSGLAHLFNGALIRRALFERIGLPDPRFVIRGDEVEFLYRTLRRGGRVRLTPDARFLHPGSRAEIHPILFGSYYAVVPTTEFKRFYLFRNRAFIFRQYGMWGYLAADVVRYGSFFLMNRGGDLRGFGFWLSATMIGLRGQFMQAR